MTPPILLASQFTKLSSVAWAWHHCGTIFISLKKTFYFYPIAQCVQCFNPCIITRNLKVLWFLYLRKCLLYHFSKECTTCSSPGQITGRAFCVFSSQHRGGWGEECSVGSNMQPPSKRPQSNSFKPQQKHCVFRSLTWTSGYGACNC